MAMQGQRRALDWVVRPEVWSTTAEFLAAATQFAWFPLTVWQSSMSAAALAPPQTTGLFESGSALTVERVKGEITVIIRRQGTLARFWQHAMRIRVGEGEVGQDVDVEFPVIPTTWDINNASWANEDFLWEHRVVTTTDDPGDPGAGLEYEQPAIIRIPVDVKSRRRLEPPDQLQLVIQRDFDGDIVPAVAMQSNVIVNLRVLLSQKM